MKLAALIAAAMFFTTFADALSSKAGETDASASGAVSAGSAQASSADSSAIPQAAPVPDEAAPVVPGNLPQISTHSTVPGNSPEAVIQDASIEQTELLQFDGDTLIDPENIDAAYSSAPQEESSYQETYGAPAAAAAQSYGHSRSVLDGQVSLPSYSGGVPAPTRVYTEFPASFAIQPRAGGPLYGAAFEWARNQGANIPGMASGERMAACGPIAAEGMVRFFANDPRLDKILGIMGVAKSKGYWRGAMQGPASEKALLAELGIQVNMVPAGNIAVAERQVRESLDRGKPVIISTSRHYFFAQGYDNQGRLFVGHTGRIMGNYGGSAQMTLSQISRSGNGGLTLLIPR